MKTLWFPSNCWPYNIKSLFLRILARNVRPAGGPAAVGPRLPVDLSHPRHAIVAWQGWDLRDVGRDIGTEGAVLTVLDPTFVKRVDRTRQSDAGFSKQLGHPIRRHQIMKVFPNQNSNFAKWTLPVGDWWFLTCDHSEWTPCKSKTTKIIVFWKCWLQIPTKRMVSFSFKTMKLIANLELQGTVWKRDQPTLRSSWIIPVNLHDPQILT